MNYTITFCIILFGFYSTNIFAEKSDYKEPKRIGYELQFSDGSSVKMVTRGSGATKLWIDGIQHNIFTFQVKNKPSVQVETTSVSNTITLLSDKKDFNGTSLKLSPMINNVLQFDAASIDLTKPSGSTTISAVDGGTPRTCGTCGGTSYWVTNACVSCGSGWLCDKIKAPW
ncbi:MAG: hypothetical protein GY941_04835 [Planctomycetes bacterium]|nr:hypothetical protein [Planctomycetota bacterium]